jgi:hypothetical protein
MTPMAAKMNDPNSSTDAAQRSDLLRASRNSKHMPGSVESTIQNPASRYPAEMEPTLRRDKLGSKKILGFISLTLEPSTREVVLHAFM